MSHCGNTQRIQQIESDLQAFTYIKIGVYGAICIVCFHILKECRKHIHYWIMFTSSAMLKTITNLSHTDCCGQCVFFKLADEVLPSHQVSKYVKWRRY